MDIHWLQHVPFEGLGSIRTWAEKKSHNLIATRLWAEDALPNPDDVRMLIIMGGPMGVHDEDTFPWLAGEKNFISCLIDRGCAILGICLGAQLLATVLGASVYTNREKEIGWFPVRPLETSPPSFNNAFHSDMPVFHWHGDTFDIPSGGRLLGSSDACRNQAFIVNDRILGLQYHLEMTSAGLSDIIDNCRGELVDGKWVQRAEEIIQKSNYLVNSNIMMERILDQFENLLEKK